jgi:hypothetical protein
MQLHGQERLPGTLRRAKSLNKPVEPFNVAAAPNRPVIVPVRPQPQVARRNRSKRIERLLRYSRVVAADQPSNTIRRGLTLLRGVAYSAALKSR